MEDPLLDQSLSEDDERHVECSWTRGKGFEDEFRGVAGEPAFEQFSSALKQTTR
jgi:hypothetical protein